MTAQNPHISEEKAPGGLFFAAFVLIFVCTVSVADSVGLVPNYLDSSERSSPKVAQATAAPTETSGIAISSLPQLGETPTPAPTYVMSANEVALPERIQIPAINLDLAIQNPETRDIPALDELLKNGPARHVDSAKLGEVGTMIIFAHSSNLPIVRNKMFQAFNRIPELQTGDMITLRGADTAYLYTVTSLRQVDASDTIIDLSPERGTRLTLVTCDTLTGKSARFVLEAEFVGSYDAQ